MLGWMPRFVCDVMCEGVARQLRLCGIDAVSGPSLGKARRFQAYRCLTVQPSNTCPCKVPAGCGMLDALQPPLGVPC